MVTPRGKAIVLAKKFPTAMNGDLVGSLPMNVLAVIWRITFDFPLRHARFVYCCSCICVVLDIWMVNL